MTLSTPTPSAAIDTMVGATGPSSGNLLRSLFLAGVAVTTPSGGDKAPERSPERAAVAASFDPSAKNSPSQDPAKVTPATPPQQSNDPATAVVELTRAYQELAAKYQNLLETRKAELEQEKQVLRHSDPVRAFLRQKHGLTTEQYVALEYVLSAELTPGADALTRAQVLEQLNPVGRERLADQMAAALKREGHSPAVCAELRENFAERLVAWNTYLSEEWQRAPQIPLKTSPEALAWARAEVQAARPYLVIGTAPLEMQAQVRMGEAISRITYLWRTSTAVKEILGR
jgi:hypothetical protein